MKTRYRIIARRKIEAAYRSRLRVPAGDSLETSAWLAVADLGGQVGSAVDRIYTATRIHPSNFQEVLSPLVREVDHVEWDYRKDRFIAERRRLVGVDQSRGTITPPRESVASMAAMAAGPLGPMMTTRVFGDTPSLAKESARYTDQ